MSAIAISTLKKQDFDWVHYSQYIHHELIKYMYEDHLTQKTMPNLNRNFENQDQYGWTAMAYDVKGMTKRPSNARSLPSLLYKIDNQGYQYYRPNLSYTSKSHRKSDLRWMVTFVLDFDAQHLVALRIKSLDDLIAHVESFGYQVSAVIRTTSGYHVYLPMQSLRGSTSLEYGNTIDRYDTVLKSIAKQLGSDPLAASAEHYFRTPQSSNVVYFVPVDKPSFELYEQMVERLETKRLESRSQTVWYGRMMSQPGMLALLSGNFNAKAKTAKENGERNIGRNNAAFTLALGMKFDGWSIEQAEDELRQWYSARINHKGLSWNEIKSAIKHAFEGKYKAPSSFYVEAFTGIKLRPLSKKKTIEERVRMQFSEIQDRVITYLQRYYLEFDKDLVLSQKKFSEHLGVKPRSLQHVLKLMKENGLLDVETKREGRSNVSIYFLSSKLLPGTEEIAEAETEILQENKTVTIKNQKKLVSTKTFRVQSTTQPYKRIAARKVHEKSNKKPYKPLQYKGRSIIYHSQRNMVYLFLRAIDRGYFLVLLDLPG